MGPKIDKYSSTNKIILYLILSFLAISLPTNIDAKETRFDFSYFQEIPILHEGRTKPLDTFSRIYLTSIYGRDSLPNMSAISWLSELLFNQGKAYNRPIFYIANQDVLNAINLPKRKKHYYSFSEISNAIRKNLDIINIINNQKPEDLSLAQTQLLQIYNLTMSYYDISRSLSMSLPLFYINDTVLAKKLTLPANTPINYIQILQKERLITDLIKNLKQPINIDGSEGKKNLELLTIAQKLSIFSEDRKSIILRIIPPIWETDKDIWLSPWQTLESGRGSPNSAQYLELINKLAISYLNQDHESWKKFSLEIKEKSQELSKHHTNHKLQKIEILYNQLKLFDLSLIFYLLTLTTLIISFFISQNFFLKTSLFFYVYGITLHFIGIIMRMVIMGRPPVSTLYESIIFASLIAVLFTLIMQLSNKKRDHTNLFIGSILGIILQFIGKKYAAEGDTMQILVAVLNTNFWLATHVITIVIGYGTCLVVGTLGHIYLVQELAEKHNRSNNVVFTEKKEKIQKQMVSLLLISLFFSLLGTILGGIWADQSWGRFWGWDPKENGAMLIVLWLILLLHSKIAKLTSPTIFAICVSITNIIVAMAWFGVNLLNVGLHSYGFTSNIASNLTMFCLGEITFLAVIYYLLKKQDNKIDRKQ